MLTDILRQASNVIQKNSPVILTTLAVSGVVTTVIMAVRATPNASAKIDIAENEHYEATDGEESDISFKEKVKLCWKDYAPATVMGVITISCIVAANTVNARRQAAVSTAYILTESAFDKYKKKIIENFGERKHEKVQDDIVEERLATKAPEPGQIVLNNTNEHLCFDCWSGRYFKSSMEDLRRIENDLNRDLLDNLWVSLNDVYYKLDLEPVKVGEDLGWSIDGPSRIDFRYSTCLSANGEPTITIDFAVEPKY